MPEAIDPPSGCRFHPRCPDAREVCRTVHPEPRPVGSEPDPADSAAAAGDPHTAACVKHDAFDVGYDGSRPIDVDATGGFDVGRTERDD
jgi:peptide/nickel transport system ATP-binding protein